MASEKPSALMYLPAPKCPFSGMLFVPKVPTLFNSLVVSLVGFGVGVQVYSLTQLHLASKVHIKIRVVPTCPISASCHLPFLPPASPALSWHTDLSLVLSGLEERVGLESSQRGMTRKRQIGLPSMPRTTF